MPDSDIILEVNDLKRHFDVSPPALERLLQGKPRAAVKARRRGQLHDQARRDVFAGGRSRAAARRRWRAASSGSTAPTAGKIVFDGVDLATLTHRKAMAPVRRRMQMIFQDPYASLNPRWRVRRHRRRADGAYGLVTDKGELRARVGELLEQVKLSPADGDKFPHEFSGGQRQRISIARALAANPEFLVCDEPTSALDVSVQAQILNLMKDLQRQFGLTYLFISHNLAVVYQIATGSG